MYPAGETGNGSGSGNQAERVTLEGVLEAREARWHARVTMSKTCRLPVLSCTLRIPYAFRHDERIISKVREMWDEILHAGSWRVVQKMFRVSKDGPEGLAVIVVPDALDLKEYAAKLEIEHPLGWMLDLDVLDAEGNEISRVNLKNSALQSPRTCLVCEKDAKECIALKRHSRDEVCAAVANKIQSLMQ